MKITINNEEASQCLLNTVERRTNALRIRLQHIKEEDSVAARQINSEILILNDIAAQIRMFHHTEEKP